MSNMDFKKYIYISFFRYCPISNTIPICSSGSNRFGYFDCIYAVMFDDFIKCIRDQCYICSFLFSNTRKFKKFIICLDY